MIEIRMFPLEAMNLSCSHTGEETNRKIVSVVRSDMFNELLNFFQGEWINICSCNFEGLDVLVRRVKPKPFSSIAQD